MEIYQASIQSFLEELCASTNVKKDEMVRRKIHRSKILTNVFNSEVVDRYDDCV